MNTTPKYAIPISPKISSLFSDTTAVAYTKLTAMTILGAGASASTTINGSWQLPLPTALDYNSDYNWSAEELGHIASKLMTALKTSYDSATSAYSASAAEGKGLVRRMIDTNAAMIDGFMDGAQGVGDMMLNDIARKAMSGISQLLTGGGALAKEYYKRQGKTYNPNEQLYFDGVSLREFSLPFEITPLSESESSKFSSMIYDLRQAAAPRYDSDKYYFTYPDFFTVGIYVGGTLIVERGPCAITSLNVNMAPEGSIMWRSDNKPVSYSLDLTFKETTVATKEYEAKTRLLGV